MTKKHNTYTVGFLLGGAITTGVSVLTSSPELIAIPTGVTLLYEGGRLISDKVN